jgi:mannose-6-phosphate isomerase-like protein (cupin superfamily)
MKKRIMWSVLALLFMFSAGYQISSWAQTRRAPGKMSDVFNHIPKSDMDALRALGGDRPARVLNISDKYHLGVYSLPMEPRTRNAAEPLPSFYHSEVSEVYFVVRGSGTAALGGELENATWDDSNSRSVQVVRGPSVNGAQKGHKLVKWSAGDTVIVSAGVPHVFGYEVTEKADIVRVVIDPSKSVKLQATPELTR